MHKRSRFIHEFCCLINQFCSTFAKQHIGLQSTANLPSAPGYVSSLLVNLWPLRHTSCHLRHRWRCCVISPNGAAVNIHYIAINDRFPLRRSRGPPEVLEPPEARKPGNESSGVLEPPRTCDMLCGAVEDCLSYVEGSLPSRYHHHASPR